MSFVRWRSLKTRVTLFTLAIFVAGIWSLSYYASRMLREDMQRQFGEQQFSAVSLMAMDINEDLSARFAVLEKVAARITPALLANGAHLQAFLEQRLILQGPFNGGNFAAGAEGTAIASIPRALERVGMNYLDRDYMVAALKEGKAAVGLPVLGGALRAPVFVMAVPIRDSDNKVIGALAGVTKLGMPNFLDKLTTNRYGRTGGYFLVAPQHRLIVTASDKSRVMSGLPEPGIVPEFDRIAQGYEGSSTYVNQFGVEVLASSKSVPVAGWIVHASLPSSEAFAPIQAMHRRMQIATFFLTLLAGALTWWMLRRQLSPMLAAASALGELSNSDLHPQPLAVTSRDEIGDLIGGFNRLLDSLGQREQALRESESRARAILEVSPVPLAMNDDAGNITFLNRAFVQTFGYASSDIPTLADWWPRAYPDPQYRQRVADGWRERLEQATRAGKPFSPMELDVRCKDGAVRTVLSSAAALEEHFAGNHLVILYDITERKQAEEGLRRAYAELEQQSLMLTRTHADLQRFAEVTAHHLQEPARRMATYAGRLTTQLGDRLDDAEARLSLQFIGQQAHHQQNLLRDVERYLASDQARGQIASIDAGKSVAQILTRLKPRIDAAGAAITVGDLPRALMDPPRLDDVFSVALDNALAHGRSERPLRIAIEGEREAGKVRYSVSDNGPGIDADYRERVFRVFERLAPGSDAAGTGIGLAILRRVAESCDGRAWIEEAPGGGCRVLFELPFGNTGEPS